MISSLLRIWIIGRNTLLESIRQRVLYVILLFGLALLASASTLSQVDYGESIKFVKDYGLGIMSVIGFLIALLSTSQLIPQELQNRTLYTILAKPVPRFEYLLGKFVGVLLLLFIAISLMSVVFVAVLYTREQQALAEAPRMVPAHALNDQLASIRAASFNSNLVPGIIIIYLKSALCAALTLLLSTFATSWIFTVIMSVVVYLIGHIQPIAREYYLAQATTGALTKIYLAIIALLIPDLNSFSLVDDIVVGNAIPLLLFIKTSVLGVTYIVFYFLVGYFVFSGKEL